MLLWLQVSRVVVSVRESQQIVEELLRAGQPIGFDGEGVNLGPKGQLTLAQVCCCGLYQGWTELLRSARCRARSSSSTFRRARPS